MVMVIVSEGKYTGTLIIVRSNFGKEFAFI
jgi:hypothetical protein